MHGAKMKIENFNNFEEYIEAEQRWIKNPNDTNAGYLLGMSRSLLNQAFVKQREEEEKEYEEAEKQKVVDKDEDAHVHITIDEYFEWLHNMGNDIADVVLAYENKKGRPIKPDDIEQPYITLSVLPGREIPAKLFYTMILADMDVVLANNLFKRSWQTISGKPFKYAFQLRLANNLLIDTAEYDRDHKKDTIEEEEDGN